MAAAPRSGRPRASSRETIAEAACELFLEQGYDATSVADITRRAGVARSSFFNYFTAKPDVLWSGFDDRLTAVEAALADDAVPVRDALAGIADDLAPDTLALAITHADAMGLAAELERDRGGRQARLQRAVAVRLRRTGTAPLEADVRAAAYAAAVLAAVWAWADRSAGDEALAAVLRRALDIPAR
jgi:AcrR family transcriptional regulator